jgi:hypothetical protein
MLTYSLNPRQDVEAEQEALVPAPSGRLLLLQ